MTYYDHPNLTIITQPELLPDFAEQPNILSNSFLSESKTGATTSQIKSIKDSRKL
jgi:hypothetical protein